MASPSRTQPTAARTRLPKAMSVIPAAMTTVTTASTGAAPRRSASMPTGMRAMMSESWPIWSNRAIPDRVKPEVPAAAQGNQELLDRRVGAGDGRSRDERQRDEPGMARREHAPGGYLAGCRRDGVCLARGGEERGEHGHGDQERRARDEEARGSRQCREGASPPRSRPREGRACPRARCIERRPQPCSGLSPQKDGEASDHAERVAEPHQGPS